MMNNFSQVMGSSYSLSSSSTASSSMTNENMHEIFKNNLLSYGASVSDKEIIKILDPQCKNIIIIPGFSDPHPILLISGYLEGSFTVKLNKNNDVANCVIKLASQKDNVDLKIRNKIAHHWMSNMYKFKCISHLLQRLSFTTLTFHFDFEEKDAMEEFSAFLDNLMMKNRFKKLCFESEHVNEFKSLDNHPSDGFFDVLSNYIMTSQLKEFTDENNKIFDCFKRDPDYKYLMQVVNNKTKIIDTSHSRSQLFQVDFRGADGRGGFEILHNIRDNMMPPAGQNNNLEDIQRNILNTQAQLDDVNDRLNAARVNNWNLQRYEDYSDDDDDNNHDEGNMD